LGRKKSGALGVDLENFQFRRLDIDFEWLELVILLFCFVLMLRFFCYYVRALELKTVSLCSSGDCFDFIAMIMNSLQVSFVTKVNQLDFTLLLYMFAG